MSTPKCFITRVFTSGFLMVGFAVALLICSVYGITTTIMHTAISVSQTYEVISAIENLRAGLVDAETGERGYVITGETSYFPVYFDTLQRIQWETDLIDALIADNPSQRALFSKLKRLIAYRLKTIRIIVETRQAGSIDDARELVSINEDKLEMGRIQDVLNRMEEEENTQLNTRIDARNTAYRHFWWTLGAFIATVSAVGFWQYTRIKRIMRLDEHARQRIRRLAEHDPLTGLPNRRLLQAKLDLALAYATRSGKMVGVMFIDLDGFKAVNDKLGHQAGDELLKKVAQRLRQGTRISDLVARLGGDEFVVVLSELEQPGDVSHLAKKLIDMVSSPFSIAGSSVCISASIGISMFPANGNTGAELLGNADDAVYRAKESGKKQYQFAARIEETGHVSNSSCQISTSPNAA
ncbi:MAG: diguanylate cyclase domain-containing protein [Burkholderiales bacterium]